MYHFVYVLWSLGVEHCVCFVYWLKGRISLLVFNVSIQPRTHIKELIFSPQKAVTTWCNWGCWGEHGNISRSGLEDSLIIDRAAQLLAAMTDDAISERCCHGISHFVRPRQRWLHSLLWACSNKALSSNYSCLYLYLSWNLSGDNKGKAEIPVSLEISFYNAFLSLFVHCILQLFEMFASILSFEVIV